MMAGRGRHEGFTLLEVMVAVAILAVSLTAIFSSEVGAMKVGNRARRTNVAALLARCKMAEVEEQLMNEGLPAIDDHGTDACCEDTEIDGYTCDWSIERVVLPEIAQSEGLLGAMGGAAEESEDPAQAGKVEDVVAGGGDMGGIASMAMELSYPVLKPSFEEQVRRVSVDIHWEEGSATRNFEVVQFVVGPQPSQAPEGDGEDGDGS